MMIKKPFRIFALFSFVLLLGFISYGGVGKSPEKITKIDTILVEKAKRTMTVFLDNKPIKTYKIALGFAPIGPKQKEGDGRTPEGKYKIQGKHAHSKFHLSLKISYPNPQDQAHAHKHGFSAGNDIMIHGLGKSFRYLGALHRLHDWTLGCIAVTDPEIEEIFHATSVGTIVEIKP